MYKEELSQLNFNKVSRKFHASDKWDRNSRFSPSKPIYSYRSVFARTKSKNDLI